MYPPETRWYEKKTPDSIEAVQLSRDNIADVALWCNGRILEDFAMDRFATISLGLKLLTKNRLQVAYPGDYIYRDAEQYFHIVAPDQFEAIYKSKENK